MTRVLVVDDEPQILRALQTNLRGAGYDVVTGLGSPNTYNLARNLLEIQSRAANG